MVNLTGAIPGGNSVNIVINAIDNFSATFGKMNKSLLLAGGAITALGVIGAGVISSAISTSIEFESAFTGVRKTVELTEKEFGDLEERFKDISRTTPVAFTELSKIGELAGQLGVSGVDNLEKFTKTIADIAVTTNLTTESAATDFARIANVMQEPLTNVDRMGAAVVALGNNFATTEADITEFAKRISGTGKIVGLSTSEVFAIGTAMSSVGVQAEAGGSAVQKSLLIINEAVLKGGGELKLFASTAGLTTKEFKKLWEKDAAKAFTLFVKGLGKQGKKAANTLKLLKLGGIRTTRALLSLGNAGDLLEETLKISNIAWDENIALTEEANKRYDTAESKIAIFRNKQALLSDQMGDVFVPILIDVIDALSVFFSFLDEHPKLTEFGIILIGVGTALGLILGPILLITAALPLFTTAITLAGGATGIFASVLAGGFLISLVTLAGILLFEHAKSVIEAAAAYDTMGAAIDRNLFKIKDLNDELTDLEKRQNFGQFPTGTRQTEIILGADFAKQLNIDLSNIAGNQTIIGTGEEVLQRQGTIIEVNIENLFATDAESVDSALEDVLKNKIDGF